MAGISQQGVARAAFDGIGRKQTQIEKLGAIHDSGYDDGSIQFMVYARDGGMYIVNINTYKEPVT